MPVESANDINNLASKFHEVWMQHNSWQKDDNPDLFQPYGSLSAEEFENMLRLANQENQSLD